MMLLGQVSLCRKENTYNCNDFDGTEPELELTEEFDTEVVDGNNSDEEDCYPDTWVDLFVGFPFLQNQGARRKLIGGSDNVLAPVRPTERKSESRIAETGSITGETRRVRDPCSHFTERRHDHEDKKTNRSVSD